MNSNSPKHIALVVTTIASPTAAMVELAKGCIANSIRFIVIGDESGPANFALTGCRFLSLADQRGLDFRLSRLTPTRHYARKNIGYLLALREGADVVVETDDDNFPESAFWNLRHRHQTVPAVVGGGWLNVYRYFSDANIWPRGLPLEFVRSTPPSYDNLPRAEYDCPIQQGLADANPDVDAIYRFTSPLPQYFRQDRRVALLDGSWCPFNSQNTTWWRDAAPLLYLPATCSFRMTDIWRSFIATRIGIENGWAILFHEPSVRQERNEHDLLSDFRDEVPGYLNNNNICEALRGLSLRSGRDHLGDNLRVCYDLLVRLGHLKREELILVDAWINDVSEVLDGVRSDADGAKTMALDLH
jgi:STELLO glycosyltransferase-like protein